MPTSPPKRSRSQISRDAKIISEMYLAGRQQNEIAKEMNLSQATISNTLAEYHQEWLDDGREAVGSKREQLEQRLEYLYRLNLESFKVKKYPGFLKNAMSALAGISKLNGLDRLDISIDAKVGISSLSVHQQISSQDMAEAKAELETWHRSLPASTRVPGSSVSANNDGGTDETTEAIVERPGTPETVEPAAEPEQVYDNYLAETDPNSPNFPLTI